MPVHSQNKHSSTFTFIFIVETSFFKNTCDTALLRNNGLCPTDTLDTIVSFNEARLTIFSLRQVSLRKTKFMNKSVEVATGATRLCIQSCNLESNTVER